MWVKRLLVACLIIVAASAVYAQEGEGIEFEETVPLYSELTEVSIPEGWEYGYEEDGQYLFMFNDDLELEIYIYDSLEQEDSLMAGVDDPIEEIMIAAMNFLFEYDSSDDDLGVEEISDELTLAILEFEGNISVLGVNTDAETIYLVDAFTYEEDEITDEQFEITLAVAETVRLVGETTLAEGDEEAPAIEPCIVSVDEADTARLRVGPGTNRSAIAFLEVGEYEPQGQASADDDSQWFKLDKATVAPNSSANEIWVAADDVDVSAGCDELTTVGASPIIPGAVAPPATNNTNSNTAQESQSPSGTTEQTNGGTTIQNGTYTLFFNPTVSGNCVGFESQTFTAAELGLTSESLQLSRSGNDIILDGDLLTLQSNGEYFGTFSFDDGSNGQVYLRPTSSTSLQGQMIANFTLDGVQCSATAGISVSR